jgi:hypothetical protein
MQGFQFGGVGVDFFVGEFVGWPRGLSRLTSAATVNEATHNVQHIQGPAALGDGKVGERFDILKLEMPSLLNSEGIVRF